MQFEGGLEGRHPTQITSNEGAVLDLTVLASLLLAAGLLLGVLS